jgi:hypothetical protein
LIVTGNLLVTNGSLGRQEATVNRSMNNLRGVAVMDATTGIPVSVAPAQRRAMTPSSTSTMTGVLSSVILIRGSSESREARARNIPGTHVSITCQSDLPVPAMFDCELPFEGLADAAKAKDFCGV